MVRTKSFAAEPVPAPEQLASPQIVAMEVPDTGSTDAAPGGRPPRRGAQRSQASTRPPSSCREVGASARPRTTRS